MDDLVAWLTQVWDERQKAAERWDDHIAHWGICSSDAPDLSEEFARIAADRQILALHKPSGGECGTCCGEPYAEVYWDGEDETVVWQRADLAWPCQTVRLLAQPYADRPGYQEAWKP